MTVRRITANLNAPAIAPMRDFYAYVFGLDVQMDLGWITTLGTGKTAPIQLSLATGGGEGTPVPEISIEVDDVDAVAQKARDQEHDILYGPTDEDWGVRRFMLHDPGGNLVNVMQHLN